MMVDPFNPLAALADVPTYMADRWAVVVPVGDDGVIATEADAEALGDVLAALAHGWQSGGLPAPEISRGPTGEGLPMVLVTLAPIGPDGMPSPDWSAVVGWAVPAYSLN